MCMWNELIVAKIISEQLNDANRMLNRPKLCASDNNTHRWRFRQCCKNIGTQILCHIPYDERFFYSPQMYTVALICVITCHHLYCGSDLLSSFFSIFVFTSRHDETAKACSYACWSKTSLIKIDALFGYTSSPSKSHANTIC